MNGIDVDGKLKPIRVKVAVLPPGLLGTVYDLWDGGLDTKQIAMRIGESEAAVYNALSERKAK